MSSNYVIKTRKRKSISLDMKMEILNRLEKQEKPSSIAKSYGINESTVRTIKKMEESIRSSVSLGSSENSKVSSYIRKPAIEKMEKALMIWIEDNVQKKIPINSSMIRQKAVNIMNNLRNQSSASDKQEFEFFGSKGWFEKFKKRYSLHYLKFKDETASADKNVAKEFIPQIAKTIEENRFLPDQVFNVDERALIWKRMSDKTFVMKNIKHINGLTIEPVLFTAENIYKALQLATKLETAILDIDPNIQRALKFQKDLKKCCSEYQRIYENLVKDETERRLLNNINNETDVVLPNISSNDDSDFVPNKKRKELTVLDYNTDTDNE